MKRLFLHTIKGTLSHSQILGSFIFVLVLALIVAYAMAPSFISQLSSSHLSLTVKHIEYLQYTSGWYAGLVILSLSFIATTVAFSLSYQTGTLPYLIRYSKLKISTYFISIYSGNLIALIILELLFTAITVVMFPYNGLGFTVTPSKIEIIILFIILSSMFIISFIIFLELLVIKLRAFRLQNLFNLIPGIIGLIFYSILVFAPTIKSPAFYYSNPYMATIISLYYGYFGSFAEFSANKEVALNLSLDLLSLSIVAWIVILNIINSILVRKIYYVSIEEGRTM